MNLYFAPLEGITTFTYRNTHNEMFGGVDYYYAPFITPSDNEKVNKKGVRDILPENNTSKIIPQVLVNNSISFLKFCKKIRELGYFDININLGCPSSTVVRKGRGSGFLKEPDKLDLFLSEIFDDTDMLVSVKTRTGYSESNEFDRLLEIYNTYPLSELIIHPRTREDYYKGLPDDEVFKKAYNNTEIPLSYNGNIFSKEDYDAKISKFPNLKGVMIGRGAVSNPAIFREIKGGKKLTTDELLEFSERLRDNYLKVLGSDIYTLHKLKEIWMYIMWRYPEEKKILKSIKKSESLKEFMSSIEQIKHISL